MAPYYIIRRTQRDNPTVNDFFVGRGEREPEYGSRSEAKRFRRKAEVLDMVRALYYRRGARRSEQFEIILTNWEYSILPTGFS